MVLEEDMIQNNIILLVISKKDIIEKLAEINKIIESKKLKISIIIPSKSTIDDTKFINYIHNITLQIRRADLKCLFLLTKEDLNEGTIENLMMFADKLIKEN